MRVAEQFCYEFCMAVGVMWGDRTFLFTAYTGSAASLIGGVTISKAAYLNLQRQLNGRRISCTKLAQTGCNSFCKAHNKESLNNLRTRDDKEVAASLASLGNNVNNEWGLANMSKNVDNEPAIRNNDGKVSVRHDE